MKNKYRLLILEIATKILIRTYQEKLPGTSLNTEKKIKYIDGILQVAPLENSIKVCRRVNEKAFKHKFFGKYRTDFVYMSTSTLKNASSSFSGFLILFRITVPKSM
ncbi:ADP-ribosyltransferase [Bacillus cereus]|uniref:ADP-ribosyltransferase n=1 Tax=Bacillus cereus TaxID=1396 RepID=UPI000BED8085|nr:hypothetical protein CON35_08490 [Bacillus cereus]